MSFILQTLCEREKLLRGYRKKSSTFVVAKDNEMPSSLTVK